MAKEALSQDLADFLVTKNFDPEYFDKQGQPAEAGDAKTIKFDYVAETGKNYGTAVVVIGDDDLGLFYGDNLGRGMEPDDKEEWYNFLEQLSNHAASNGVTWSPKDINQLKHTLAGIAAIKEGLFEGYYGNRKTSYMGEQTQARLVINHNRQLGEEDKRFRYVESLFIETADQERFRLGFKSLAGGRAMLEHVRQGGRPYDVRGNHITEIVREMAVLSRFNRAQHRRVYEGVTQELVENARQYYHNLQETMKHLGSPRGYQAYFETWAPDHIGEAEALVENLRDLFVEQTLDARIEAALPTLAKIQQQGNNMKEAEIFESWINNLSEGTWALPETPDQMEKLNQLMSAELIVGPDATNATELLYDIVGDDELFDILNDLAEKSQGRANIWDDSDVQRRLAELGVQTPQSTEAEPADVPQDTAPPVKENAGQLSVQQLATISDEALDKAYGYGRSAPGNTFGWQANLKSAAYAKQMIDQGVTDIEAISDAIHKGWNTTAQAFVQDPDQFDDTAKLAAAGKLEAKLQQRAQLMKQNYAQLPEEEKEKDRVVARALLQAIKGPQQQGVAEDSGDSQIKPGMKTQYGTVVSVEGNTVTVKASNGDMTTVNIHDIQQGMAEGEMDEAVRAGYVVPDWKHTQRQGAYGAPTTQLSRPYNQAGRDELAAAVKKNRKDNKDFSKSGTPRTGAQSGSFGWDGVWKAPEDENSRVRAQHDNAVANPKKWKMIPSAGDGKGVAEGDNMSTFEQDRELAEMLKYAGVPVKESVLTDSTGSTLEHIKDTFRRDVKDFTQTGDMSDALYDALYDYYFDDMPYGTKKARDGDPHEWISDRFAQDIGLDEGWKGALAGGLAGAGLGSVVPALGTVAGGIAGAYAGHKLGDQGFSDPDKEYNARQKLQKQQQKPVSEGSCNMTAEGEYCPEHGLAECYMEEGFLGKLFGTEKKKKAAGELRPYMVYDKFTIYYDPVDHEYVTVGTGEYQNKFEAKPFPADGGLGGAEWYGISKTGGGGVRDPLKVNKEALRPVQPGMQEDGGAVGMPYSMGEGVDDPINSNSAMTGSYYEGKETDIQEGDALLARIKSLALLR